MKPKRKGKDFEIQIIEELKKKIRTSTGRGNFKDAADIHNQLGNLFRQLNDFDEGLEHHMEELKLSTILKDKMSIGIAHRNIGETYIEMHEEEKAIKHINIYLKLAQEQSNMVEEQRAFISLGRAYLCLAEKLAESEDTDGLNGAEKKEEHLNNALKYFRAGLNILEEHELQKQLTERDLLEMKCGACQNIGVVNDYKGKSTEAVLWLNKAFSIGTQQGFHNYVHPCSMALSLAHVKMGNLKEARNAAHHGVNAAIALGSFSFEIESWIQESKVYFFMNEIEVGKGILKKLRKRIATKISARCYLNDLDPLLIAAIKISRAQDNLYSTSPIDHVRRMDLHELLGDNFTELANYTEAVNEYLHCVRCAKEIPGFESTNKKKISRLYFSIAVTYKDKNDFANALKYFQQEMELHTNNVVEKFKTQTNIVLVLEKMKISQDKIVAEHQKAIELARKTRSIKREATAIQNLGIYYRGSGNKEKADEHFEKVNLLKVENALSDLEETEPDSQDLLDEEEEIDLDNLSSEAESDMDDDIDHKKNEAFGKRKKFSRVNELGETQLHVAAKKGDVKSVRRLLRHGHAVNLRDTAGWLPLHEACNFGHYEVVEELLKRKAWINDSGGQHCGRTTPLHDAASNGHIRVIQLLLKNGANVLAKEEDGNYPIDLFLNWKQRIEEDSENLSEMSEESFRETKELMKSLMAKGGRPYQPKDEAKAQKRIANKSSSPKFSLMKSTYRDSTSPTPVQIGYDNFDPDDGDAAVDLYSEAITGLRARNKRNNKSRRLGRDPKEDSLVPLSPPPKGALISENKNVTEDWLLDDLNTDTVKPSKRKRDPMDDVVFHERGSNNKKVGRRKRVDVPEESEKRAKVLSSDSSDNECIPRPSPPKDIYSDEIGMNIEPEFELPDIDDESNGSFTGRYNYSSSLKDDDINSSVPLRSDDLHQQDETSRGSRSAVILSSDSDSDDFKNSGPSTSRASHGNKTSKLSRNRPRIVQTRLPFKYVSANKKSTQNQESTLKRISSFGQERKLNFEGSVLRLKVRILEHTMLVPVTEDNLHRPIDWLCQDCSVRYFKTYGVKPILKLSTKDGALLSGTDTISLVLGGSDTELVASVSEFDLPPLTERFKTACTELEIPLDYELISAMNVCQSTSLLNLSDFHLRGKLGKGVCHSLLRQYSLRELCLSGCSLFDDGIKELSKVISTLPNVCVLNLSMNGITSVGFQHFVKAFSENVESSNHSNPPLSLYSLDVSHNSLGNSVGRHLSELLTRLVQLKHLCISNCNFTLKLFTNSRTLFIDALNKSKLEDLDISYNEWGELGLEKFLQKLNPSRLKHFDCTGCGVTDAEAFAQVMCNFFSRNEDCCLLKNLKLSDCSLTDETLRSITEQFSRLVSLESLTVSNNESLTLSSLETIIEKCMEMKIPLQRLDMGCCPSVWKRTAIGSERIFNILEKKMETENKLSYLRMTIEEMDKEDELSVNECKVARIYDDYSGSSTFECKRKGNSVVYEFVR